MTWEQAYQLRKLAGITRLDRITSDPNICRGKPTVRGLRYPVEDLLDLLASGMSIDEVLADYEDLEKDDLLAALEFGAIASEMRACCKPLTSKWQTTQVVSLSGQALLFDMSGTLVDSYGSLLIGVGATGRRK